MGHYSPAEDSVECPEREPNRPRGYSRLHAAPYIFCKKTIQPPHLEDILISQLVSPSAVLRGPRDENLEQILPGPRQADSSLRLFGLATFIYVICLLNSLVDQSA